MSHLGERLTALVDGELGHDERDRALAHLAVCEQCRVEADGVRRLKQRLRSLPDAAPSTGMLNRLLSMGGPVSEGDEAVDFSAAARSTGAKSAAGATSSTSTAAAAAAAAAAAPAEAVGTTGAGAGGGGEPSERRRSDGRPRRDGRAGGSFGRPAAGTGAGANRPRRRSQARSAAAMFAAAPSLLPSSSAFAGRLTGPGLPGTPGVPGGSGAPALPAELVLPPSGAVPLGGTAGFTGPGPGPGTAGAPERRRTPRVRNLAMGAATFAIFGVGTAAYVAGSETAQAPRVAPALQRFSLEYALTSTGLVPRPNPAGSTTQAVAPTAPTAPTVRSAP